VEEKKSQSLPTSLSILGDDATGRLLVDPAEVIAQVQNLETQTLSPEPTLTHGEPFPWHLRVPPNHKHTIPMISGYIALAIVEETRTTKQRVHTGSPG
jgi:hypothetical protein